MTYSFDKTISWKVANINRSQNDPLYQANILMVSGFLCDAKVSEIISHFHEIAWLVS